MKIFDKIGGVFPRRQEFITYPPVKSLGFSIFINLLLGWSLILRQNYLWVCDTLFGQTVRVCFLLNFEVLRTQICSHKYSF